MEGWIDWEGRHTEAWRFFRTGQFFHVSALREEWLSDFDRAAWQLPQRMSGQRFVEVIGVTYSVTEFFLFLANLSASGLYETGVVAEVGLEGIAGAVLHIGDFRRVPLMGEYACQTENIRVKREFDETLTRETAVDAARETIVEIFHQFNWDRPNEDVIRQDQRNLLDRRFP